ncbi:MAG: MFS transporter [Verrucomicrobiota bacterium]
MKTVLANINFRRLWISQIALALGDALMQMGLLELFRVHGYDERAETAKIFFAVSLPALVLGPVAMVYLGRWQRRTVLMISDGLRAVVVVGIVMWLLPLLAGRVDQQSLLMVYLGIGAIGVVATFYLPARSALLPNLVEPAQLMKANTLFATSMAIVTVGGRALGGFVAEHAGVPWAVSANALMYLVSVGLLARIQMNPHATTVTETKVGGWSEFKTGLAYLWEHPTAMPLVMVSAVFAFLLGLLVVVFVGYAMDTLGLRTGGVGYLVAAAGIGAGIGIGLLGQGKPWTKSDWLPFAQLLLAAGALVALSFTTNVWRAALAVVVLGAVASTVMIYIDAKLQAQIEDVRRGAVFAARGMLNSLTMLIAFWLQFGSATFKRTPPPTVLFWLGISAGVVAVVMLVLSRRKRS